VFYVTGKAPLHYVIIVLITDINQFRFSHLSSQNEGFQMLPRFFCFKHHCWSGVWTKNSGKKIPDVGS